jgi:hypothetical protein
MLLLSSEYNYTLSDNYFTDLAHSKNIILKFVKGLIKLQDFNTNTLWTVTPKSTILKTMKFIY